MWVLNTALFCPRLSNGANSTRCLLRRSFSSLPTSGRRHKLACRATGTHTFTHTHTYREYTHSSMQSKELWVKPNPRTWWRTRRSLWLQTSTLSGRCNNCLSFFHHILNSEAAGVGFKDSHWISDQWENSWFTYFLLYFAEVISKWSTVNKSSTDWYLVDDAADMCEFEKTHGAAETIQGDSFNATVAPHDKSMRLKAIARFMLPLCLMDWNTPHYSTWNTGLCSRGKIGLAWLQQCYHLWCTQTCRAWNQIS